MPKKGDYIYSRGFACYVTGKTRRLYGADWHITVYDEGPNVGRINLLSERNFQSARSVPKPDGGWMI